MNNRLFRIFSASCTLLAGLVLAPTQAQAVNISIGVGGEVVPGVYGSVNIDNGRYPALVYAEPLIVSRTSRISGPVYLHVPPGHLKKWGRYCGRYDACSRPVYFVKSHDYYDFSPQYIEQRYVYRDRITYVNRGGYSYRGNYDRHDHRRDHRHGYHRGHDRKHHWKHESHRRGHGHGKHGRHHDD